MSETTKQQDARKLKAKMWLKRLGFTGFLFFFVKGLVWLAVIFGVAKCWE